MTWPLPYNTTVVLLGTSLLGACAGMVGTFAVLRRRALAGDALAHATLPGVCIAFLIVEQRYLPALLLGALISGLLGILVIGGLRAFTRIKEDAAIGIVLSVFYGGGIALMGVIQHRETIGSKAGLKSFILGNTAVMSERDVALIAGASAVCLLAILTLYKEFQLVAFDPEFASAQGWPSFRLDLLLMAMVTVTVVIGLPAVGVVLVVAALIIPAAAARFWTEHLGTMLILSAVFGLFIGGAGSLSSAESSLPTGPAIVLIGTALFLLSLLFAPRRGLCARMLRDARFRKQFLRQKVLQSCYELVEPDGETGIIHLQELQQRRAWNTGELSSTLEDFVHQELLIACGTNAWKFSPEGLELAGELVHAQRLWQRYFEDHPETTAVVREFDPRKLVALLPPEYQQPLNTKGDGHGQLA